MKHQYFGDRTSVLQEVDSNASYEAVPPSPNSCSCNTGNAVVSILERRTFDFSNFDGNGLPTPEFDIPIVSLIDVVDYYHATLVVRCHSRSMTSGQRVRVQAHRGIDCPDEPESDFVEDTSLMYADIDSSSPTATPGVVMASATDLGACLQISMHVTQAGIPASMSVELSACLVLRRVYSSAR